MAWPVAAAALILGACGSDAQGSATASTIDLRPTEYITKEPVPTTVGPIVTAVDTTGEQQYTIQAGDFPIGVADKFGVPVESLLNYNDITAAQWPFPGDTIRIPPGGTPPAATAAAAPAEAATDAATDAASDDAATATTTAPVGDTIPDAGDNCAPGTYVLADGDIPIRVAEKFDTTVSALQDANAGTPGYSSFIVGTEIVIPAKADC